MGPSLLSLHVLSGFGGRARSEVIMGHVFPQGALAAITMVGSDGGDGVGRVRARYEPGLLLYLMPLADQIWYFIPDGITGTAAPH